MGLLVFVCGLIVIAGVYIRRPRWWERLPQEWQIVVGVGTFLFVVYWGSSLEQGLEVPWWYAFILGYGAPLGLLVLVYPFALYSVGAVWWKQAVSWVVLLLVLTSLATYLLY